MKTLRIHLRAALACLPLAYLTPAYGDPTPIVLTTAVMDPDQVTAEPTLSWLTAPGQTYFVQISPDMENWTYLNEIISGDGNVVSIPFDPSGSPKLFARVRYTNATVPPGTSPGDCDFDGDGLTNQQELDAGTDPFVPDTDLNGNGLPDAWELHEIGLLVAADPMKWGYLASTGTLDPNISYWDDGFTAAQSFKLGFSGANRTLSSNLDSDGDGVVDSEDADPTDPVVDWQRAVESSYAVINLGQEKEAWSTTRASVSRNGCVLWNQIISVTNQEGWVTHVEESRVWKQGNWSSDLRTPPVQFAGCDVQTNYTYHGSEKRAATVTALTYDPETQDRSYAIPQTMCGDFPVGTGLYYGSRNDLPWIKDGFDENGNPVTENRSDGMAATGIDTVATIWKSVTGGQQGTAPWQASPIAPQTTDYGALLSPFSVDFDWDQYFYEAAASPGGALAILGGNETEADRKWKIWIPPAVPGTQPYSPGDGPPSWERHYLDGDRVFQIKAIEDGGSVAGMSYRVAGVTNFESYLMVIDSGQEQELPDSRGYQSEVNALCRVPLHGTLDSRLVAAGSDLWVKRGSEWRMAQHAPTVSPVIAVASDGVLLGNQAIWRNGREVPLDKLVENMKVAGPGSTPRYTNLQGLAMNSDGAIVALADDAINTGDGKKSLLMLLRVDITMRKPTETETPPTGLCVKKGESIIFDFNGVAPASSFPFSASTVKWQTRQIKGDGSFTAWQDTYMTGCEANYEASTPGIFQTKAIFTPPGGTAQEFQYVRKKDAPHAADMFGAIQDLHRKGAPDYFGTVDKDWQISLRDKVVDNLGSKYYAWDGTCEIYSGMVSPKKQYKCNIFVYHKCNDVGVTVPLIERSRIYKTSPDLPPYAIDWWNYNNGAMDKKGNLIQTPPIVNWYGNDDAFLPQPGWIVSRAEINDTEGYGAGSPPLYNGHVGILDYDGSWVNAGYYEVNKYCHLTTPKYQPARFKSYSYNLGE